MNSPHAPAATGSAQRPSASTRKERVLAFVLSAALAAVAALALVMPTTVGPTSGTVDPSAGAEGAVVVTSQVARGKATPPGSAITQRIERIRSSRA